jgi:anti-anti-sigma factor
VFDALAAVPDEHKVVLDFAGVERVNSMGLAQLMRCLEAWKESGVKTEAVNLNRMVSMLFKMTGLNRYFGADDRVEDSSGASRKVKQGASQKRSTQFRRVRRAATPESTPDKKPQVSSLSIEDKMTFSVSLQSNQQLSGWYFLNTLLQRRLKRAISIDINQLGSVNELHNNALVFAKPFDACALMTQHQFIPIARPANDNVEVSIVVRNEDKQKSITDFSGAPVATSTQASFVFLLGRFFCDEYDLDSATLDYQFTGNQLTAMRRLLDKDVDMLFMQKNKYQLLSPLSRAGTYLLEESDTDMAYHMLLLSPAFAALQKSITDAFLDLQGATQGIQVLNDLGVDRWCKPETDEIAMLQMLYSRYVT